MESSRSIASPVRPGHAAGLGGEEIPAKKKFHSIVAKKKINEPGFSFQPFSSEPEASGDRRDPPQFPGASGRHGSCSGARLQQEQAVINFSQASIRAELCVRETNRSRSEWIGRAELQKEPLTRHPRSRGSRWVPPGCWSSAGEIGSCVSKGDARTSAGQPPGSRSLAFGEDEEREKTLQDLLAGAAVQHCQCSTGARALLPALDSEVWGQPAGFGDGKAQSLVPRAA